MKLDLESASQAVRHFVETELPNLKYPAAQFDGRGIVIAAGGRRYMINAWVAINMLRHLGCRLPIQCWYLGPDEFDADWADLVGSLNVTLVNAYEIRDSHPNSWCHRHARLHGWELKPYAITHCPFREVLFLDADNVPVVDPTFLFDTAEFHTFHAVFWPDYSRLAADRTAWKVFGDIPYRDEPEFESGQILLDKHHSWSCLMLCHWYMQNSNNFYFYHVHGDKEIFHLAWRRLDQPYAMPSRGIRSLPGVMCQHDFQGRRIFQHRNQRKWSLGANPATPDFHFEKECIDYLTDLRQKWCSVAEQIKRLSSADKATMEATAGLYLYERVGYDQRTLGLTKAGFISDGAAGREINWYVENGTLVIRGEDTQTTARLVKNASGSWCGRWERDEQMPVALHPLTNQHTLADQHLRQWTPVTSLLLGLSESDRDAMEELAGSYEYERVGFDRRRMLLRRDGTIGEGGADCERFWYITRDGLVIASTQNIVTAILRQAEQCVWQGKWNHHERMPVVLRRRSPSKSGGHGRH